MACRYACLTNMFRLDLLGGHLNINTYVSLLIGNLQELDSAGVRAVARGLPQLGLPPVWSSDHSGNLARVLRATTARNALLQPVMERIVVRRSRHDSTEVEQQIAVVPPAELAAKLWEVNPKLLFGESAAEADGFWIKYRQHRPTHPLFLDLDADLSFCFPYALHGDEGAGLDKASVCSGSCMHVH